MPLGRRESAKMVFTGNGSVEMPVLRKQVPASHVSTTFSVPPERRLKRRSKSLSDLADKTSKIQKYLDRRQVIHMDPNDKDCCSHTELAPSTMMTLALELHEPRYSKAIDLFKQARSKFVCHEDNKDSILPQLWVVPKGVSKDRASERVKLASHLQPSQEPVTLRSKTSSLNTNSSLHATILSSEGKGMCRRSGFVYPTVRCIPMSEHDTQFHNLANAQDCDVTISKDDIEKDLKSLTVADLIGSPDTAFTDTESESIAEYDQCNSESTVAIQESEGRVSRDQESLNVEKVETGRTRIKQVAKASMEDCEFCEPSFEVNTELKYNQSQVDGLIHARDRTSSTASSLTTVSSLSSSPLSTGPAETNKNTVEILQNNSGTIDNSYQFTESNPTCSVINEKFLTAHTDRQKYALQRFATDSPISNKAPKPPKRSKSLKVMERIRKTGREKELSTKAKRFTTDCGNNDLISRMTKVNKLCMSTTDKKAFDESNRKSLRSIYDNSETQLKQTMASDAERSMVFQSPSVSLHGQHTEPRSASLFAAQGSDSNAGYIGMHAADSENQSSGKTYSVADDIAKLKYCQQCEYQIPALCIPIEFEIKPDKSVEVLQNVTNNMEREKWFRNGQISVVDGSTVTLARQSTTGRTNESKARSRRHSVTQLSRKPRNLFLSDIIKEVRPSSTKPSTKQFEERIVPSHNTVTIENSPSIEDKRKQSGVSLRDGLETNRIEKEDIFGFQPIAAEGRTLGCARDRLQPKFDRKMKHKEVRDARESTLIRDVDVVKSTTNDCKNGFTSMCEYQQSPSYVISATRDEPFRPVLVTSTCHITTGPDAKVGNAYDYSNNGITYFKSGRTSPIGSSTSMNFNKSPQPYLAAKSDRYATPHAVSSGEIDSTTYNETITQREAGVFHSTKKTEMQVDANGKTTNGMQGKGGPQIYSSSIRIIVGGNARSTTARNPPNCITNVRERKIESEGSRKFFDNMKVRRPHVSNERADITPDMKQSEHHQTTTKLDTPMHSSIDESDFSGVVDGPTKNVKEIRAMFKAQDHANYAKPKQMLNKSSPPATFPKPKLRSDKPSGGSNRNSAEVAQQVMGLFKGAIELEQQTQNDTVTTGNEPAETETVQAQGTLKDKTVIVNEEVPMTKENVSSETTASEKKSTSLSQADDQDRPYVEIIKNPSPVAVANGHERKSSVKQEKVLAESYDESLDQFYDVFDQLTTR